MSSGEKHKGLIAPAGAHLGKEVPLKFVRAKGAGGHKSVYAELNLTSMVDMLTILVCFLLMNFSASGELSMAPNIVLPEASNFRDLERAPFIGISKEVVTLDADRVALTSQLESDNSSDWKIIDLHDKLVQNKTNFEVLHKNEQFPGTVIIQADKLIDFKVVKKVLSTCYMAGYANINFAVGSKGKGGG